MNEQNQNNSQSNNTPRRTNPRSQNGRRRTFSDRSGATGAPRRPAAHTSRPTNQTQGAAPGQKRAGGGKKRRGPRRDNRRKSFKSPALTHRMATNDRKGPQIPEIMNDDTVRIVTLSGLEQIGRNMWVFETKDDIIVIDAGFEFVGEGDGAPGIEYILPNTQYLEERKHKIRAMVVTHGHLDHIGGIPFVMERIGNPPIYTQYLTSLMIKKRQEEFPHMDPVTLNVVKEGESFTVGKIKVKTFPVTHSIPDAMGVAIETKHGDVVITGDIRLSHENEVVDPKEVESWQGVGKNNNLVMLADSTNADREGFSAPESLVFETLDRIIRETNGRIIIGTFASQFERLIHIISCAEKYGKHIVPEGRSIKTNIEIAQKAELIKIKPGTIISAQQIQDYPADKIVVLATGAQGEEFAALMRMATDKHKFITLTERDILVLSSSVIPGNENAVQKLKDNIYRKNVRVINYRGEHVHSSGHGWAGELNWVRQQVKPKFLIPVHGHHYHLKSHMYSAIDTGFPKENIFVPDNGTVFDIENGEKVTIHKQKAPTESIMVDGFTVGARQEVVLRDRMSLAADGMFVVIATINTKTGKLKKSPDIISRGFIYLRENQQLLSEARVLTKRTVEKHTANMNPLDLDFVKDQLTDTLNAFLLQKTHKNPMVIPVLIGV